MHNIRKITNDLIYVGASDRRLALFENVYPIPRGVSYNSYILLDEQTVLLDCADLAVMPQFMDNIAAALAGRKLNYIGRQPLGARPRCNYRGGCSALP